MLGGGSFTSQNQTLPGAYINFISAARANAVLSERGIVTVPMILDWGPEKTVFEVTNGEFQTNGQKLFGYSYDAPQMLNLRELFANATKGIFYRLNSGVKAANDFATAKYGGVRGNDVRIVIAVNVEDEQKYDVTTMLDGSEVDRQTVTKAADLAGNDYVDFKQDATLAATAGTPLTGGTNGEVPTGSDHSAYLAAIEPYTVHILCCPVTDEPTKNLYIAFTKRMRENAGVKFQTVVFQKSDADYEGVISVENTAKELDQGLVYWTAGAEAACAVNKTNENRVYNGEYTVNTSYTQTQLADGIKSGKFMFHKAGDQVRVLMDINTLTSVTADKNEEFASNQTIRVLDQIGNDIASMFNTKYLGTIPNDDAGRISLWNDIVTYNQKLAKIRAIEEINAEQITVAKGDSKRAVIVTNPVTPINCMSQLYMTVIID
ncbi:phage tail sheath family protein [Clostridium transplantifaecale]|uniref:phage tail sheath family protein n=1 Tax=Clostridium transplantifaecale TaxID=2479838 RepID=UPI000F640547|nr:phage tail sheath family protein [Clostridium transplantifaecale]